VFSDFTFSSLSIRVVDPDSITSVDPDPYSESGYQIQYEKVRTLKMLLVLLWIRIHTGSGFYEFSSNAGSVKGLKSIRIHNTAFNPYI
jgi:hypothetical protein